MPADTTQDTEVRGATRTPSHRGEFVVRPVKPEDDPQLSVVIRTVLAEFACRPDGCSGYDGELDGMFAAYSGEGTGYWVVERSGRVFGGGGFGPLPGGSPDTCELQKMYFLTEARGLGLGRELLRRALDSARAAGYRRCYLETLKNMDRARRLYASFGFRPISRPEGNTGHSVCDIWYVLDLTAPDDVCGLGL